MPGRYEHIINIDTQVDNLTIDSLPAPFTEVTDDINNHLKTIQNKLEKIGPMVLPSLSRASRLLQQDSIANYESIISGALSGSISESITANSASIGTDLFYAEYVNDGRGPVHAKNKKFLHFITKNGTEIFAKSVGPAAPRPYLDDSSEALSGEIDQLMTEIIEAVLW